MDEILPRYKRFVLEYLKDMNERRAAVICGFNPDEVDAVFEEPGVRELINANLDRRMDLANIDAAWLLQEMIENHYLARQEGKLSASNQILSVIGKHTQIDAFAAERVEVKTDSDLKERLKRGRSFD